MGTLGVGIIGFGRIGAEHAGWLATTAGARAAAVADPTPARQALARERGLDAYDSVPALLADPRVEAVLVATPTAMHAQHVVEALSAAKHVMVEKPMALDLAQSRFLIDKARERNLTLGVFHNRRWDIDYLTARQAIRSGALGKVMNVESRLGQWASCVGPAAREYRPNWRNEAAYGGGGLYDWGSHFVDQMWRLLHPAKPVRVFAQLRGNVWSTDCDDFARVLIDFDNGVAGLVEINTTTTLPLPRWRIDGTKGTAASPHSPAFDTAVWAALRMTPAPDAADDSAATVAEPVLLPPAGGALTEPAIWDQFAAAVRGKGAPAVTPESVLPTMTLLDAARVSGQTGTVVQVRDLVEWVY